MYLLNMQSNLSYIIVYGESLQYTHPKDLV